MKTFEIEIHWKTGGAHRWRQDFIDVIEATSFASRLIDQMAWSGDIRKITIQELTSMQD